MVASSLPTNAKESISLFASIGSSMAQLDKHGFLGS